MPSRLTGKEHIIRTYRFPDRLEFSANGSGCARVFFVEVHSSGPENASSRCVLLSLRWLFAAPYQSSNATIDDTKITLSRATARWNRRRTLASLPLINAMHAFVSSGYVVIESSS